MRFPQHLKLLYSCRTCPNVCSTPVTGAVEGARMLLVGQAPGPHEPDRGRPFAYTAGRRLFAWFAELGVDETTFREKVYMAAVIRCFPGRDPKGGDRVPSPAEIAACSTHLDREIAMLSPGLVIAVGTLAAAQLVGDATLARVVGKIHRVSRAGRTFDVVVLPHPSGRSTWLNREEHARLFRRSLKLIGEHEAWVGTFG
ncbi:MAG: uracil-DNA glycosylase family protein [Thermoanaerobaculia bacterium]